MPDGTKSAMPTSPPRRFEAMNATTKTNILRRQEQLYADLQEDGVACQWSQGQGKLFEAAMNGPYADDHAQEAIDRVVSHALSSRTEPRPSQLSHWLNRAAEAQREQSKPAPVARP